MKILLGILIILGIIAIYAYKVYKNMEFNFNEDDDTNEVKDDNMDYDQNFKGRTNG